MKNTNGIIINRLIANHMLGFFLVWFWQLNELAKILRSLIGQFNINVFFDAFCIFITAIWFFDSFVIDQVCCFVDFVLY